MPTRTKAVKVAAVVSSLLLAGGYIFYRSASAEQKTLPGSKSFQVTTSPTEPPAVFYGSKSGRVILPTSASATAPVDLKVLSGSKSAAVFAPSDVTPPGTAPSTQP